MRRAIRFLPLLPALLLAAGVAVSQDVGTASAASHSAIVCPMPASGAAVPTCPPCPASGTMPAFCFPPPSICPVGSPAIRCCPLVGGAVVPCCPLPGPIRCCPLTPGAVFPCCPPG